MLLLFTFMHIGGGGGGCIANSQVELTSTESKIRSEEKHTTETSKNSNFVLDKAQEAQILLRIFFHSYKFSPTSFLSSLHTEIGVVCGGARVCVCVSLGFVVFAPT